MQRVRERVSADDGGERNQYLHLGSSIVRSNAVDEVSDADAERHAAERFAGEQRQSCAECRRDAR